SKQRRQRRQANPRRETEETEINHRVGPDDDAEANGVQGEDGGVRPDGWRLARPRGERSRLQPCHHRGGCCSSVTRPPATMGLPSACVIFAQHMPCEPSAREGWPDALITVPAFSVSGVHPVRVSDAAGPSSICHSTFCPFSSGAWKYRNE